MRDDRLQLPKHLAGLYARLRELNRVLREERWRRWGRIDPFVEALFGRTEKAEFFGAEGVVLHDSVIVNGEVAIGPNTHVGQFCSLDGSGGLIIGSHCSIAAGVRIMTHDSARWAVSGGREPIERAPVAIGDRCFIGVNAVVTRGVTVGEGSVIGAGAVVTRNIPAGSIAIGVPARVVGRVEECHGGVDFVFDRQR